MSKPLSADRRNMILSGNLIRNFNACHSGHDKQLYPVNV